MKTLLCIVLGVLFGLGFALFFLRKPRGKKKVSPPPPKPPAPPSKPDCRLKLVAQILSELTGKDVEFSGHDCFVQAREAVRQTAKQEVSSSLSDFLRSFLEGSYPKQKILELLKRRVARMEDDLEATLKNVSTGKGEDVLPEEAMQTLEERFFSERPEDARSYEDRWFSIAWPHFQLLELRRLQEAIENDDKEAIREFLKAAEEH